MDNLTNLNLNIEDSFTKNKDLLEAFLDVSGAFDNANFEILLEKLADDIAIYSKRYSTNRNKKLLEKSIRVIQKNLFDLGLDLAPHKTIFIHFN